MTRSLPLLVLALLTSAACCNPGPEPTPVLTPDVPPEDPCNEYKFRATDHQDTLTLSVVPPEETPFLLVWKRDGSGVLRYKHASRAKWVDAEPYYDSSIRLEDGQVCLTPSLGDSSADRCLERLVLDANTRKDGTSCIPLSSSP